MIQMQTNLDVADNSGARRVMCIKVLRLETEICGVGDIIVVSIKEAIPRACQEGDCDESGVVRTPRTFKPPTARSSGSIRTRRS